MNDQLNVLLVVLDSARADHLSCYGYSRETTPFLDQLAREGVRFEHVISTSPWTLASHASLLTGLFPCTHGATEENRFLASRHRMLSADLKEAGYRTAAFCTNPWVSPQTGFGQGFDLFHTQRISGRLAGRATFYARRASDRVSGRNDSGARRTNRAVLEWLARCGEPFFAFVHYNEPHLPFHPPAPYDRTFMPSSITNIRVDAVNQDCNRYIAGAVQMTDEDFVILRALYDGELRYADMRLQEIAAALVRQGRWDRTLVIVTADHGEHLGEHQLLSHKFVLHDTLLRIPLVMRCPPLIASGFVVDELTQLTDIVPTVLEFTQVASAGRQHSGRALIRGGQATAGPWFTISERYRPNLTVFRRRFPQFDVRQYDVRQKAIRTRREKFVWHSDEANELYDLVHDPGEEDNRIEDGAERAEVLRRALFDWFADIERSEGDGHKPEMDAVMRRQLERSGCIE